MPTDLSEAVAHGRRPRVDYVELARAFDADLADYDVAEQSTGLVGRLVARVLGQNARLAWHCYRRRHDYEVVVTDGEQIGLPLAVLLWCSRRRTRARHVMIVHILSVKKKALLVRWLRLGRHIDEMLVYASAQRDYIADQLGYPREQITLTPFMVDTNFFCPTDGEAAAARPQICSAGLELRDYPTLIEAVRGMDVSVVLAAASPWSKRHSELDDMQLPANVTVVRLDLFQLRQLYTDSSIVVMPLRQTDFQAGITTILEAMAMARPIVCTRTTGQTDTIEDGVTGVYVPVGDIETMKATISGLLAEPDRAAGLGTAARAWVLQNADIERYADRLAARVAAHRR